jgi:hypothetical protein
MGHVKIFFVFVWAYQSIGLLYAGSGGCLNVLPMCYNKVLLLATVTQWLPPAFCHFLGPH